MAKSNIFYEVKHVNGTLNLHGNHCFSTAKDAIDAAKSFKENPMSDNDRMSEESAEYWKAQTLTIERKTITVELIETI